MKNVLFIGQKPDTVDFSDPALPPGLDAAKIQAGIAAGMKQITECGWHAELCLIRPDESARRAVEQKLADAPYDCVVIGAGIRIPPKSLMLFEALVNSIHKAAPGAFIAFNTNPEDTSDAAGRWIEGD